MAINNEPTIQPQTVTGIFTKYIAKTLPLAFDESMSYYECLCALLEYLNETIVPDINNVNDAVAELQAIYLDLQDDVNTEIENFENGITSDFNDLQEFVNNYFENNFPQLVHDTLDEMAENGTLENLLNDVAHLIKVYDTYEDMYDDSSTFTNGLRVKTMGYYNVNDGGAGEYIISTSEPLHGYFETLNNCYAILIIKDETINLSQIGGKPNDNTFDNKTYFEKYVTLCNRDNKTYKLIIGVGDWYTSPLHVQRIGGVHFEGLSGFPARNYYGTRIKAINEQNYIFKFGGKSNMDSTILEYSETNTSNIIKNLTFSSDYLISYGALCLEYADYGVYEDIYFNDLIGTALYIRSSWENYFNRINFRKIAYFSKPIILFDTARPIAEVSANISATSFDKLMFENCCGNLIQSNISSNLLNNQFGEINIENSYNYVLEHETSTAITQSTDLSNMTPLYVFYGVGFDNTFDTINYTGLTARENYYTDIYTDNYYFQGIFGVPSSTQTIEGNIFNNVINNIFLRRDCTILTTNELFYNAFKFSCANIVSSAKISEKFQINNGASSINVLNFTDRNTATASENKHINMLNSLDLYKYGIPGTTFSNANAINDLGLILKKGTNSTIVLNGLYYPYNLSETTKAQYVIRCKGSGTFTLRGLVNNTNSNKVYTLENSNDWQNIIVDMNYDAFSPVTIISSATSIEYDTISFIGFTSI